MRVLPASRRIRFALLLTAASAATIVTVWTRAYRPWEAHYRGRPTNWWARFIVDFDTKCRSYDGFADEREHGSSSSRLVWEAGLAKIGVQWGLPDKELDLFYTDDAAAIPVLLELLRHRDREVRRATAFYTGPRLHEKWPKVVAMARIAALADLVVNSPNAPHRGSAAWQLREYCKEQPSAFDSEATATATPALVTALRDEALIVRHMAALALLTVDPEAARREGVPEFGY
jgi:hypothetical protein